jgi:hypothetical protein
MSRSAARHRGSPPQSRRAVEGPLRIGRISVDILGPIPLREAVVGVSVACRTYLADDGVGLARADLSGPDGLIGEVAQPLLVQKRKPDNGVS